MSQQEINRLVEYYAKNPLKADEQFGWREQYPHLTFQQYLQLNGETEGK